MDLSADRDSAQKTAQDLNGLKSFPSRCERFERFFFGKLLKLLKSRYKKPLKSQSFVAAVERFLNGF